MAEPQGARAGVNAQQAAEWDGPAGAHRTRHAAVFDAEDPPAQRAVPRRDRGDLARPRAGHRLRHRPVHQGRRARRGGGQRTGHRPVRADAGARPPRQPRGRADQCRLRAGRRPGAPVPGRRLRRGDQPVRLDVLRRPGGRVRQHRARTAPRRAPGADGLAGAGAQRVVDHDPRGHRRGCGAAAAARDRPEPVLARPTRPWPAGFWRRRGSPRSASPMCTSPSTTARTPRWPSTW